MQLLLPRVLVVEDEFLIRLTLAEALSDDGFDVLEAESGDAAMVLLRGNPDISLLLADVQLPGSLDGQSLVRMARETAPSLPAILMSGRPAPSTPASPLDVFIAKPYLLREVCAAARRLTALEAGPVR